MIGGMPLVITIPFDPVFLRLGPISVHWYGVAYALAFAVGMWVCTPFFARRGISRRDANDIYFWNIVIGLLGARLFFVVQQPDLVQKYLAHPVQILAVWNGGMAFFGALAGCFIATLVLTRRRGLPTWTVLDAGAIFATLPRAIGRLGNIINGDILGPPSNLPWAFRYTSPNTFAPHIGVSYQPANLYELLVSLALFALVVAVLRARPAPGWTVIIYLAAYAVSQFLIFFTRTTEPVILLGLKQAQVTAVLVLLVAVPLVVLAKLRWPGPGLPSPVPGGPDRTDGRAQASRATGAET